MFLRAFRSCPNRQEALRDAKHTPAFCCGFCGVTLTLCQDAGHEPVCLVPGSMDKCLPVPDCTLQKSLDTHSEGSLLF